MRPRSPRAAAAGCACAAALVVGGCGPAPPATVSPSDLVLPAATVERQPPDSPQRALLAWWRAVQTGDRRAAAAALPRGSARLAALLPSVAGTARRLRPAVVEVDRRGSSAVIYTETLAQRPIGTRRFAPAVPIPQAFVLDRSGGRWRLHDAWGLLRLVLGGTGGPPSR